jgi:hypothetical protein
VTYYPTCSVEGCESEGQVKGLCRRHYYRSWRAEHPDYMPAWREANRDKLAGYREAYGRHPGRQH